MSMRTVAGRSAAELEVKRSRFIAVVDRADTEKRARAVVAAARASNPAAGHHCSAFVLGDGQRVERSNDDGEPSGTAGTPMLEVLRGHRLTNVVVVVTRYFGGTKLGTGGLARAYAAAASAALHSATILDRVRRELVSVELEHTDVGRIESELRARGVDVVSIDYAAAATVTMAVSDIDSAGSLVASLTAGRAHAVPLGHTWIEL